MLLILLGQIGSCFFVCIYTQRERERERLTVKTSGSIHVSEIGERERLSQRD